MPSSNELLRKDGSADANGLAGTDPAKLAFFGQDQSDDLPLSKRYAPGVDNAGVRHG